MHRTVSQPLTTILKTHGYPKQPTLGGETPVSSGFLTGFRMVKRGWPIDALRPIDQTPQISPKPGFNSDRES